MERISAPELGANRLIKTAALSVALMGFMGQVSQAGFVFADWNTTDYSSYANGTLNGVGVHYSGQVAAPTQVGNTGATQYWTEPNNANLPYTPVTGALPTRTDIVALSDPNGCHEIDFAAPVWDPVMLICSLGQIGIPVTYSFNQTATVLSSGWSYWNPSGPGTLTQGTATSVVGNEGDGVVGFSGWVSKISWTTDNAEYWHGFTLAVPDGVPVPEPTTMIAGALLLLPFGASTIRILRKRIAA
jgi:hypothetical protein